MKRLFLTIVFLLAPSLLFAAAAVTTNKTTYTPGETITVTATGGLSGVQEWVGLYVSTNPDSSFSFESTWAYLNNTKTEPASPVGYPAIVTFVAPTTAGTYNVRFFREAGVANRLAISLNITVAAAACTHYASPTGSGSTCTSGSPCQINSFWGIAVAGNVLCLNNGTYTGANAMIKPPTGKSGSSGNPITVRALADGEVLIDGQYIRFPVHLVNNNWLVIEGINAMRGRIDGIDQYTIYMSGGGNNIFRRTCAWDSYEDPNQDNDPYGVTTRDGTDTIVWGTSSSSNNLFEDVCAFGTGRYAFYIIKFASEALNNTIRRGWFRFDRAASLYSEPRATMLPDYYGDETTLVESSILEWRADSNTTYGGNVQNVIMLEGSGFNGYGNGGQLRSYGNLLFVGPNSQNSLFCPGCAEAGHGLYAKSQHTRIRENTYIIHPNNTNFGRNIYTYENPLTPYDGEITDVLTVGQNNDIINSSWNPTGVEHQTVIANVTASTRYRYLTNLWQNGTKTANPLWPWPMQQRIWKATGSSSFPRGDVHQDVRTIMGGVLPPSSATVVVSASSFTPGQTAIVTVDKGFSALTEWVGLFRQIDPDSASSFESNWKYTMNGTQVTPTDVNPYPRQFSFTVPTTPGTYNMRLFAETGTAERIAISADFTVTSPVGVTWVNNRGGSGTATGTASWTASSIPLKPGINQITVTATDASSATGTDQITVTYAPTFPGNSLVGAWGFEEPSGTTATDSTPGCSPCNDGALVNGVTRVTGRYGNGVRFNPATNQSITVPDANSLDMTQSWTISAWVRPTAVHTDFRTILYKNSAPLGSTYRLYASSTGHCAGGAPVGLVTTNGSVGPTYAVCNATPLAVNSWTHVTVTYDGIAGQLVLYRNGVASDVTFVTPNSYLEPSALALQMGGNENGEHFEGDLDEVRLYNFAIPVSAGGNTTPGGSCAMIGNTPTNLAAPSVVGDMNCQIVLPLITAVMEFGASSTIEFGAGVPIEFGQ